MSEERFPTAWSGRIAVIGAAGEIDLINAGNLSDAMLSALNTGARALIVDMTAAVFLDSAGVNALVHASKRAAATGASLRLAVTALAPLRVLDLVGVDRLIEVHPTVAEAIASLPDRTEPLP
ncbi:MAG: STAS domain-containing protein [Trebonia sp.]